MSQVQPPAAQWRKSSRCDNSLCLEVASGPTGVAVRDNAQPDVHLSFRTADWRRLVSDIRAGTLDR